MVHLAALQVPFCRENPVLGAAVNVVGTMNVFEAVEARLDRIPGIAYACSAAVYGPSDPSPAPEAGGLRPATHYGVFKQANEGNARIAWQDDGVASIGIRPYVVYGAGRDQGLTSGPTAAMAAAARGRASHRVRRPCAVRLRRGRRGRVRTGRSAATDGSLVANFPGVAATMPEVVAAIEEAAPAAAGKIDWADVTLPFPAELEATALERRSAPCRTPRSPRAWRQPSSPFGSGGVRRACRARDAGADASARGTAGRRTGRR